MRRLFSKIATLSVGLAMAVSVGVAVNHNQVVRTSATTVTFTPGTSASTSGGWTASAGPQSGTKDGITLACTNGVYNSQLRFYASSTVTVSSTVGNITKLEFTCTGSGKGDNGP